MKLRRERDQQVRKKGPEDQELLVIIGAVEGLSKIGEWLGGRQSG